MNKKIDLSLIEGFAKNAEFFNTKDNSFESMNQKIEYNCDCYSCQCDGCDTCDCVCQSNCCDAGPCYSL